MKNDNIKSIIDRELKKIQLNDELKNKIRNGVIYRKPNCIWKNIAASIMVIILGGTTVSAGYYMLNKIQVNNELLPELDSMQIVQMNELKATVDDYGMIYKDYSDYTSLKEDLGIDLLNTDLSQNNPYMLCHLMTDTKDFAIIRVDNYIIGDTSNYLFIEEGNRYSYDNGDEYFSSVSLTADLILSESQMNNGWETDYLGLYQFVEAYTSKQGYTVNIVADTIMEKDMENYVSEKVAIFVSDGIRYSLKGRISIETLKYIVDTMK